MAEIVRDPIFRGMELLLPPELRATLEEFVRELIRRLEQNSDDLVQQINRELP